jgi:NADPH:quinone reductase-like Zn-dependent oxidoreductase
MKAYQVTKPIGIEGLELIDLPEPRPARGEVVVSVRACSLNYRDLGIIRGGYYRNDKQPVIPVSDMAGVIAEVGEGVTGWKVGDRVIASFVRDWLTGPPDDAVLRTGFGGGIDGFLRQRAAVPAHCLVAVPPSMSLPQASTLPCAGVTAWHALTRAGTRLPQSLLLLGTGGVSMFGVQLGRALGCRCIVTSSSDAKLEVARSLGATDVINYKTTPDWQVAVRAMTAGRGVDHVLEIGGAGTLARSIAATRVGGTISLIGLVARAEANPPVMPAALDCMNLQGVYVGSRAMLEDLVAACVSSGIEPVIDRVFAFEEAKLAYAHLASQAHVGKVVIAVGDERAS